MKRIITVLMVIVLVVGLAVPTFASDDTETKYTTATTNAYVSPTVHSKVVATFPAGVAVTVYTDYLENGFDYCFTNETEYCWIPQAFLSKTPSGGTTPYTPEIGTDRVVVGTQNYLALRSNPSRNPNNEIGRLYNGDTFFVKEFRTDGFAYGRTRSGKYGYVVSDYLEVPGAVGTATTYYAGHDWSRVYDYEYYKANNPDVYAAYGDNPTALIAHFVNSGIYEGRQGRADWNVHTFMSQHPDLVRVYGNDYSAYYKIACGIRP